MHLQVSEEQMKAIWELAQSITIDAAAIEAPQVSAGPAPTFEKVLIFFLQFSFFLSLSFCYVSPFILLRRTHSPLIQLIHCNPHTPQHTTDTIHNERESRSK